MKSTLFILLFLVTGWSGSASGQSARFVDRILTIKDGAKRINLGKIGGSPDEAPQKPCVHAVLKRHDEYFVVVTVSEWSRGYPSSHGMCGAGVESYLKWLHVAAGQVAETKQYRYASCVDNREGAVKGWQGPIFTVITTDELEDKVQANEKAIWQDILFTFDAHHPETGIKEEYSDPYPTPEMPAATSATTSPPAKAAKP